MTEMSARGARVDRQVSLPLGVVLERRDIDNPWQDHVWRPVAVFAGALEVAEWKVLSSGKGWTQYHAATLPLELHRPPKHSLKKPKQFTATVMTIHLLTT